MDQLESSPEEISLMAGEYFGNGFHCAEAVVQSVLDGLDENSSLATAHATAFGGGFGRTHAEACGALSGALIVIGHLYGRSHPSPDWEIPAVLGGEMHRIFMEKWGTAHCQTLCSRFGEDGQMDGCRQIVRSSATELWALLQTV